MSLRIQYALYVIFIHVILVCLSYFALNEKPILFILSELLVLVSLMLSYQLYLKLIKPIELMRMGAEAISEEDYSVKYVYSGVQEMDALVTVYNDMIDKLRQRNIEAQEHGFFLKNLFQVAPVGMIILDYENNVFQANPLAVQYLGLTDYLGRALESNNNPIAETMLEMSAGESKMVVSSDRRQYNIHVSRIVHKGFYQKFGLIQELTDEILKVEKDAYGKVIRMMSHEVNNSIGAVNSLLQTTLEYGFSEPTSDQDLRDGLETAIRRNKSLVLFLENFAKVVRTYPPQISHVQLHHFLKNSAKVWESKLAELGTTLEWQLQEGNPTLQMDAVQMEQVFHNAIKNAIEAQNEDSKSVIRITTSGRYSGFCISDNGVGISKEASEHLHKPFYSTKAQGQGIGLTLSKDILSQHKATYRLYSESGWTHFEVRFGENG